MKCNLKSTFLGAAVLLAASAASFGQGSDSAGTGLSITPGSPTAPNLGIGANRTAKLDAPADGLSLCEKLVGAEREQCLKKESATRTAPSSPR